jgi:hypothetical protein
MDNIVVHKKKRFFNKLKQNVERFLIYVFALIGMLATLQFAINAFREAGEWYFHERLSVGEVVEAQAETAPLAESVGSSSVNSEDREEATPPLPLEIDEVIDRIGFIESNNGKTGLAKTCADKGMSNNYGYNPPTCFKSDQEAREAVKWQLKKYADQGLDLNNSLCRYNTGERQADCDYAKKFNSI